MRLLLIHAKSFSYVAKDKAIDEYEDTDRLKGSYSNVLVVFVSVERGDDKDPSIVSRAADEIIDVFEKVNASTILIYPYAHLSQELSDPSTAIKILSQLEKELQDRGREVDRAPFGWYKEFSLTCYGHPLSELSRTIKPGELGRARAVSKRFFVMGLDGELYDPGSFDYSGFEDVRVLVEKEVFKKEHEGARSRASEFMRKFGFEWEPYSDHGHMRYEPHATAILEAVSQYSWMVVRDLDIPVFRIRGTNMFDLRVKAVKEHADLFGDRLYEVGMEDSKLVLRYAACHQQFAMLKDWILSYRDLPLGMFEVADSYRYEQRGELVLGFRMRKFNMPDLHVLCRDLDEAMRVSLSIRERIEEEARKVGRDYVAIINVTEGFLSRYRDFVAEIVKRDGKPALIVVYPDGIYYWVINIEYNIIDTVGRPREIATFQIDVGNAERFNIKYVDESGNERHPVIIHTAILGSIERYIYMLFDTAARLEAEGKTPYLPLWVSPIQVRIIPVKSDHLDYALKVYEQISSHGVRCDIDDRDESLAKKLRDAGIEWVNYILIVGDREVKTGTVTVRERSSGKQMVYEVGDFIGRVLGELKGYPKVDLSMPRFLSKRPSLPYLKALE